MNIGSVGSGLSYSIVRHYTEASREAASSMKKIAANTRIVSAADNPSGVANIERLKSQISENKSLAQAANPGAAALKALGNQTEALKGRFEVNLSNGSESSLRDLVSALRASANFTDADGLRVFAGDPANPEKTVINHAATAAVINGSSTGGSVTFATDSVELEGGLSVNKSSLSVEVDGTTYNLKVNAGTYTNEEALALVSSALGDKGVSVRLEGDSFALASSSNGADSSLKLSGSVANALGVNSSAKGADAFKEEIIGAPGSLNVTYGGRSVSVMNLNEEANKLEKLIDNGDLGAAQRAAEGLGVRINNLDVNVKFTAGMLEGDSINRLSKAGLLQDQLDNITKLDLSEETLSLARSTLKMEQSAWAMRTLASTESSNIKTLLGLD